MHANFARIDHTDGENYGHILPDLATGVRRHIVFSLADGPSSIECTIGGGTTGRDGVRAGTMGRNHIGAVHVLRLHRAIHTIHVTT